MSAQEYRRDGLVAVPFGPGETLAAGVGAGLPVMAALKELGEFRRTIARDGLPVVQAEMPGGVHQPIQDRCRLQRKRQSRPQTSAGRQDHSPS